MKIDAQSFDYLACTVFAPVYPVIAGQILEKTRITQGTCLDIGCGGGYLGLALVQATDLLVLFLDESEEMLDLVRRRIAENGLEDRTDTLRGDVTDIGLQDDTVDLAVSRGSVFFWEDCTRAFREIYRVLAPGGMAYIGGGFGSAPLLEAIAQKMKVRNHGSDEWYEKVERNLSPDTRSRFKTALKAAEISYYSIIHNNEEGLWIIIEKRTSLPNQQLLDK
ncbi:MAG: class I SAM-dependent methyltransferase [Deltaproteobacteria bacterium]|jgi:ubiquinone/menaquinone biosynthesis C-methylase UbiE|nr:class I SAM-dependent methyltransferase [Deltaproteobacteria bacterium]